MHGIDGAGPCGRVRSASSVFARPIVAVPVARASSAPIEHVGVLARPCRAPPVDARRLRAAPRRMPAGRSAAASGNRCRPRTAAPRCRGTWSAASRPARQGVQRAHVDGVDVGPLLAVDLDVDEGGFRQHQGRPRGAARTSTPIYMEALHELGEQGGWPLTMFLTSAPSRSGAVPTSRKSRATAAPPSCMCWRRSPASFATSRARCGRTPTRSKTGSRRNSMSGGRRRDPGDAALADLARRLLQLVDPDPWRHRGRAEISASSASSISCGAPACATACPIRSRRSTLTLTAHRQGGIYDHLGGGFARYSRRRALAGAAFREDALRQCPARSS